MKAAVFAVVLMPLVVQAAEPRVVVDSATGVVMVRHLAGMLDAPEVTRNLDSGLTNGFVIQASVHREREAAARGAARVDIRWELWDEVYLVDVVAFDGHVTHLKLASKDDLASWWSSAAFPVLSGRGLAAEGSAVVKLVVTFVPFSQSEVEAARRWVTQSGEETGSARNGPNQPEGRSSSAVVNLVVATSIVRRAILRREWTVKLETGGGG
ncbi:MAG: hypothetical protein LJE95_10795 [Acidobacteria bacterium]|jgi:hypothetical protein|nr:hypothetical protein [Acidobacteriota bacterium]